MEELGDAHLEEQLIDQLIEQLMEQLEEQLIEQLMQQLEEQLIEEVEMSLMMKTATPTKTLENFQFLKTDFDEQIFVALEEQHL